MVRASIGPIGPGLEHHAAPAAGPRQRAAAGFTRATQMPCGC